MDRAGRIDPQDWMIAAETRAVLAALTAAGATARFVGGCVRDAIVGRAVKDIDIATAEPPETVMRLLEDSGIRAEPTGIDHGTVTAVMNAAHFEVTTLRHDVESFGRRARVAFTDDWQADAERRDFTINALYCDGDGSLYDPTGGLADLRAGRVRFVGEARVRIEEDVLRLLRFFRFHAWYGSPPPDAAALAACRALADRIPALSAERVWSELRRILLAPDPAATLDLMDANGVLVHALAEATDRTRLRALVGLEQRLDWAPSAIRRLAASLAVAATAVPGLARRYAMSRKDAARLAALVEHCGELAPVLDAPARRRALYRFGADLYRDLVLIGWAADGAADKDWPDLWDAAAAWTPVALPVGGDDAIALGAPKGPQIGRLLGVVEAWWVGEDFRPGREQCLARLKEAVRNAG